MWRKNLKNKYIERIRNKKEALKKREPLVKLVSVSILFRDLDSETSSE
jgi:hypothetical protein